MERVEITAVPVRRSLPLFGRRNRDLPRRMPNAPVRCSVILRIYGCMLSAAAKKKGQLGNFSVLKLLPSHTARPRRPLRPGRPGTISRRHNWAILPLLLDTNDNIARPITIVANERFTRSISNSFLFFFFVLTNQFRYRRNRQRLGF